MPLSSATLGAEARREEGEVGRLEGRGAVAAAWTGGIGRASHSFIRSFVHEWRMVNDGWTLNPTPPPFWCPPFGVPLLDLSSRGGYIITVVLLNAVYKLVLMYSNCLLSGTMMVHVKEEGDRCVQEVRDVELIFTIVCG